MVLLLQYPYTHGGSNEIVICSTTHQCLPRSFGAHEGHTGCRKSRNVDDKFDEFDKCLTCASQGALAGVLPLCFPREDGDIVHHHQDHYRRSERPWGGEHGWQLAKRVHDTERTTHCRHLRREQAHVVGCCPAGKHEYLPDHLSPRT